MPARRRAYFVVVQVGLAHIFIQHTSASLTINENAGGLACLQPLNLLRSPACKLQWLARGLTLAGAPQAVAAGCSAPASAAAPLRILANALLRAAAACCSCLLGVGGGAHQLPTCSPLVEIALQTRMCGRIWKRS